MNPKRRAKCILDGNSTSPEWQRYPGDICVAAVGAFEQHGRHLPLNTDILGATHYARIIAEELGAPLLPTLPFGTSLEHSGFRGTVSLRPETLMQVIRDLADEVARQGFRTLILYSGHGGNHCLTPVVRDINRRDGPLKILLVSGGIFADPAQPRVSNDGGLSFHSDAAETSLMLTIAPELVRSELVDRKNDTDAAWPWQQTDLTTFGVGHFCPDGVIGTPSAASRAAGQRRQRFVRKRMMAFIRDRLQRLERQRRYAGAGGIALRPLAASDLPAAARLAALAGWNQTEEDWRILLDAASDHCLAAVANGRVVGTATAMVYGRALAWIGMVLVDPEFRRLGIATRLMETLVGDLTRVRTVRLDATPAGREVYQRLGFADECALTRMVRPRGALAPPASSLGGARVMTAAQVERAIALDRRVFGANRHALLAALRRGDPAHAWSVAEGARLLAAGFSRPGRRYHLLGPIVATTPRAARAIAAAALHALCDREVAIDVPDAQGEWRQWLIGQGFRAERPFIRMRKGPAAVATRFDRYFALAGPEFG